MSLADLKRGDRVARVAERPWDDSSPAEEILTVEAVGSREVRTSGGSRWLIRRDGRAVDGMGDGRIRPLRDGDEEDAKRSPLRKRLSAAKRELVRAQANFEEMQRQARVAQERVEAFEEHVRVAAAELDQAERALVEASR